MPEDNRSAVVDNSETRDNSEASPPEVADPAAALTAERDQLAQEKAELQDRLLRLQAEFENFRRRIERERMEFVEYAGSEVVRSLLSILDDFERALKAADPAESEFVKGVELIYNRLVETLKKQGLEVIQAENASFDPHVHQAVQRVETDEVQDGTILEVFQKGYNFKGRQLRPAMVKVAVKG